MKVSIIISSFLLVLFSGKASAESLVFATSNEVISIKIAPISPNQLLANLFTPQIDTTISDLPEFIGKTKSEIVASDNQIIESEIAPAYKLQPFKSVKINTKSTPKARL